MSNSNGHRWSKFWWQDHQGDAALRSCSLAARGYWVEVLCVMHVAAPIGHLLINGRPPTHRQMGAIAGCSEKEARNCEVELEAAGVFSRTTEGVIFCRRMVRDAAASDTGREHIAKRWNGARTPDPPNRVPIREPSSKPNGGAYSEPYRPPSRDPIAQKLEVEADSEEEKKVSKSKNLLPFVPVLARVAAACETPPAGTYGAETEPAESSEALRLATKNILEKVTRRLESSGKEPRGKPPKLTLVEQGDAIRRGPILDETGQEPLHRGPVDPQRTVEEQLAWIAAELAREAQRGAA